MVIVFRFNNINIYFKFFHFKLKKGLCDVLCISEIGVYALISKGRQKANIYNLYNGFSKSNLWDNYNNKPRLVADINGDGKYYYGKQYNIFNFLLKIKNFTIIIIIVLIEEYL